MQKVKRSVKSKTGKGSLEKGRKKESGATAASAANDNRLYTLDVSIISGLMTEEFVKQNPVVSRTIQIRGGQTLEQLHEAIFAAFDRFDNHMYEFQIGGRGPMDPKARKYVLSMVVEDAFLDRKPDGEVARTVSLNCPLRVIARLTHRAPGRDHITIAGCYRKTYREGLWNEAASHKTTRGTQTHRAAMGDYREGLYPLMGSGGYK